MAGHAHRFQAPIYRLWKRLKILACCCWVRLFWRRHSRIFRAKGRHRYRLRLRRNNTYSAPLPPSCGRASAKARICGDKGWRFNQSGTWPRRIPAPLPVMTRTQRHPSRAAVSINCANRLSARAAVRPCKSSRRSTGTSPRKSRRWVRPSIPARSP